MKKKKHPFRKFIVFLMLVGMGYLAYYVYTTTDVFVITQVEFDRPSQVDSRQVIKVLGSRPYYLTTSIATLEKEISSIPLVKTCEVVKVFPDTIRVTIEERVPVVALDYSDRYLMIDENLIVVDVSTDNQGCYVARGYSFDSYRIGQKITGPDPYILTNVIELIYYLHYAKLEDGVTIDIDEREIIVVFNPKLNATLGDGQYMEKRFNNMLKVYHTITADGMAEGTIIANHNGPASYAPFKK